MGMGGEQHVRDDEEAHQQRLGQGRDALPAEAMWWTEAERERWIEGYAAGLGTRERIKVHGWPYDPTKPKET